MGISVQLYRIRIGSFETNKQPRKMNYNKLRRGKCYRISILIFSILILQLCNGCYQPQSDFIKTSHLRQKHKEIGQEESKLYSWAQSGLSINKFQKIINGNRRSIGYKLAVWNCGRGLVQEGSSIKLREIIATLKL